MLDMIHEHIEVFGIESSAHGVGHVGEDSVSTSTGTREVFPANGSVLLNLVRHEPVAIFLGKAFLTV